MGFISLVVLCEDEIMKIKHLRLGNPYFFVSQTNLSSALDHDFLQLYFVVLVQPGQL